MFETISMRQLEALLDRGGVFTLLDVRDMMSFWAGHLEGAVNIPLEELEMRTGEIPKDRPVIIYCGHGSRSLLAARLLDGLGFHAVSTAGGLSYYRGRHFVVP
ncbi:MAG: rhodanese-like domain-containing protein [Lachnospiraceae bacterium]|nr:rhodanese-like domain-containing protein [Lachnospiraceae bacterium]